ncbi:MAG: hydrogenase 3 maturation endopeptidase HyCI [bacterium]
MSKVLILGVGNRHQGDDGVGCRVIDLLNSTLNSNLRPLAIDAETVPENYLGLIIKIKPERVLIVDACLFGGEPGEFRLFDSTSFENLACPVFSTHAPPLNLIAQLLIESTEAQVYLLGIQPYQRGFGEKLSPVLTNALPRIVRFIQEWLFAPTP